MQSKQGEKHHQRHDSVESSNYDKCNVGKLNLYSSHNAVVLVGEDLLSLAITKCVGWYASALFTVLFYVYNADCLSLSFLLIICQPLGPPAQCCLSVGFDSRQLVCR